MSEIGINQSPRRRPECVWRMRKVIVAKLGVSLGSVQFEGSWLEGGVTCVVRNYGYRGV
jgi:hypothetical protein